MASDLTPMLEKWGFIGLGVFTTCCYSNNFVPLELLRFPQKFSAHVDKGLAVFTLPNWVPQDQGILQVGGGELCSKLRDLPLPKQVKRAGDNQKTLSLQLPGNLIDVREVRLTYWPLFRFAHTGKPFVIEGSTAAFACRVVDYAACRAGFAVSKSEITGDCSKLQIETTSNCYHFTAEGINDLSKFSLSNGECEVAFDLKDRSIKLSDVFTPNLSAAIRTMVRNGNSLKNCLIDTSTIGHISLRYQGALGV